MFPDCMYTMSVDIMLYLRTQAAYVQDLAIWCYQTQIVDTREDVANFTEMRTDLK